MGAIYRQGKPKQRKENDFSGGINQGADSFAIGYNQSAEEYGFDTDAHPFAQTAKGRVSYGGSGGAETRLLTSFGYDRMIRAVGTKLQYDNNGSWTDIAGTYSNLDWDATNFEVTGSPALILTNGADAVQYTTNGTTATTLSAAPKGKFIVNDTVRVWIANVSGGQGDYIYWSKYLDASDWTATEDAGSVQYFTDRGGDITAMRGFYGEKYVWKKDSMAVITGKNYYTFKLDDISNDVGCVSAKTIQEVGDTLFWLGESDVYAFKGGSPVPIGQPVRNYLDRINQAQISKCCALTDGIRYYLCIPIDNDTEPTIRMVYDPRYGIWRVPGKNENYRYSVRFNNVTYVGDASGQTYKFNTGTTNNGAPLAWSIETGPQDEGFPEAEKIYSEFHMQGYFPEGSTLTVAISTTDRGENFQTIDYDPTTEGDAAQNRNLIVPFDRVPLTHWLRRRVSGTGQVTLYKMQTYYRLAKVQR